MIDIKTISGELLLSVPILEDAVIHEELMASDYVALSWSSESDAEIPAGAYIEYEGERYSLLEPYRPERADEVEYRYKPRFYSRVMAWDKQPACVYTYEDDGKTIKSREFDWSFVGSPADAMYIVLQAIRNETGEEWSLALSDSLPSSIEIKGQASSILAVLSDIANQCETEYWVDRKGNIIHLSKCEHGDPVALTVGDNVGVPSVTSNGKGYFTRYYALGSTRNITQASANINGSVNKRLTLNPDVYPMGYKDIKGHYENGVFVSDLQQGEIFSSVLIFDGIYPSSDLVIYDVRPRIKYNLDGGGNKVVIGGTEDAPVYDQYAVWYFKIRDFEFTEDLIIPNKKLSVHFKSGQLTGQEFELTYHAKASSVKDSGDVVRFEIEAGDYEILFKNEGDVILPSVAYLIPQDDNKVTLFNIEMPSEYTQSAMGELEEALDNYMAKASADSNSYEVSSNPVAFYEAETSVGVGRKVTFVNGGSRIETRVLMVEKRLDYPCQQKIRVGNNLIKGSTKELRENVESLNKDVDVIAAFNDLSKSIQDSYGRAQALTTEFLLKFDDMFYFADENTIGTKYSFFSEQENSAGGVGEAIGTGGGGGDVDLTGYATEQWVQEQGYAKTTDIPSKVSELTNDKGYITSTDASATYATKSAYNSIETRVAGIEDDAAKMESSISGIEERVAEIEGSYATDEDLVALEDRVTAIEAGGGTGSGDVDLSAYATRTWVQSQGYALATAIPTKTSQLTNNSGFITSSSLTPYALKADVPTKTSQITNDSGFITPTALAPYAKIADMPTKVSELDNDAGYLASLTADLVRDALGYTPFNASNFTATYIKSTLGIADWAMAATKPSYRYSEISGTPDLSLYALATDLNAYLTKATASSTYASKALLTSTLASYLLKSDIADWAKASSKPSYSYSEIKNTPDLSVYALASALADYALKTDTYTKTDIADILKSYVLADDISSLVTWFNNVGSKFSKDTDGTIKMDGDFYTTGENSAGDAGDVVSGGTGGLDEAELEDYLTGNGYATQTWVQSQGYASSSALNAKQDKITDLSTIRSNAAKGATALQSVPSEYITETELDQKGFATTGDLSGKVDKVAGKGLSTNDYTTADKNKLAGLENYDDSALVERVTTAEGKITANTGNITNVSSRVATLETWFNAVGKYFTYDSASGAFKLTGNFYTTGENSAGGKGEQELNLDDLLARIVALESLTSTGKLAIDFNGLDDLADLSGGVSDFEMAAIGLSSSAIDGLLNASYNKVIDNGVNRNVWNYTAYENGGGIYIQLMQGDGLDTLSSYSLSRSPSTGYWTILYSEK